MRRILTKRSIAWSAAGLAVVVGTGAYLLAVGADSSSRSEVSKQAGGRRRSQSAALQANSKAVRVKTIRPTREHLQRSSTQAAHVDPYEEADLFAKTSGYLQEVHVDIGDRVRKDQVLAEIWIPESEQQRILKEAFVEKAQAEQKQAEAAVKAAESLVEAAKATVSEALSQVAHYAAEVKYRKIEYDRHLQLFKERALQRDIVDEKSSQFEAAEAAQAAALAAADTTRAKLLVEQARLLQAHADLTGAAARVKVAQADLNHLIVLLNYAKITAPYDGVVTKRLVHPGAFIQSASDEKGDALFHVANTDRVRIVADLPETDSSLVKVGQPATLRVDALRGQEFKGKVARFADALDNDSRTMRVEVALDAANSSLRPGMYGAVTITLADYEDAMMLPASVLVTAGGKPGVMVASNGRAERRAIEIGQNDGLRMHVLRGLSDDDQVIAEGKDEVRDGQRVEVLAR